MTQLPINQSLLTVSGFNQSLVEQLQYPILNQSDVDLITPEELKAKLQLGEVRVIDVRESWELKLEGKIAQSYNIPGLYILTHFWGMFPFCTP